MRRTFWTKIAPQGADLHLAKFSKTYNQDHGVLITNLVN